MYFSFPLHILIIHNNAFDTCLYYIIVKPTAASSSVHCTTGPMAIFDPIFGSEERKWEGFFDLRLRRSKMGGFFDLRTRRSKTPPFSIFYSRTEDRRTPPHFRSSEPNIEEPPPFSIFGAEDRRPPIFNHRSSEPNIEETPHLRSSAPKNGSKIHHGAHGDLRPNFRH